MTQGKPLVQKHFDCKGCGVEVKRRSGRQEYCTTRCRERARKLRLGLAVASLECRWCGASPLPKHRRGFCSDRCQETHEHAARSEPVQCDMCGVEFSRIGQCGSGSGERTYCGAPCTYYLHDREAGLASLREPVDCKQCGVSFCPVLSGGRVFCDDDCKAAYSQAQVTPELQHGYYLVQKANGNHQRKGVRTRGKRRAAKKNLHPPLSPAEVSWLEQFDSEYLWYRANGLDVHQEHILPIELGGLHRPNNLQLMWATDNFSKGHKHPRGWTLPDRPIYTAEYRARYAALVDALPREVA